MKPVTRTELETNLTYSHKIAVRDIKEKLMSLGKDWRQQPFGQSAVYFLSFDFFLVFDDRQNLLKDASQSA